MWSLPLSVNVKDEQIENFRTDRSRGDGCGFGLRTAKKAVDAVFAGIVEAAKKGEEVSLPSFGKFKVKDSAARQGRNPATGETIEIAASRKLGFSPAKQVKDVLAA